MGRGRGRGRGRRCGGALPSSSLGQQPDDEDGSRSAAHTN